MCRGLGMSLEDFATTTLVTFVSATGPLPSQEARPPQHFARGRLGTQKKLTQSGSKGVLKEEFLKDKFAFFGGIFSCKSAIPERRKTTKNFSHFVS